MEDVLNRLRINTNNLTAEEWELLEELYGFGKSWVVPTPEEWARVPGVLSLVDIRRGYDCKMYGDYQFGCANIRLNEHGEKAIEERRAGRVYVYGKSVTQADLERIEIDDDCYTSDMRGLLGDLANYAKARGNDDLPS